MGLNIYSKNSDTTVVLGSQNTYGAPPPLLICQGDKNTLGVKCTFEVIGSNSVTHSCGCPKITASLGCTEIPLTASKSWTQTHLHSPLSVVEKLGIPGELFKRGK